MRRFAEAHLDRAFDFLNERLAFERTMVELYDRVLRSMQSSSDSTVGQTTWRMREHRDQKAEHVLWLEGQIQSLGYAVDLETDRSHLVAVESEGLRQIIDGDFALPHLLHALMTAELSDHAGWTVLIALADLAEDEEARREFSRRLHEEEEHLLLLRKVVERFACDEVLGEDEAASSP
jgi:bacterioferritin (cytochrome b1)